MLELTDLGAKLNKKGANFISNFKEIKNENVLVSKQSALVDVIISFNKGKNQRHLITIDSENLLRAWDVEDCTTVYSFKIPLEDRVTATAIDETCSILAVGSTKGEAKVLNVASGGVLYNLPRID